MLALACVLELLQVSFTSTRRGPTHVITVRLTGPQDMESSVSPPASVHRGLRNSSLYKTPYLSKKFIYIYLTLTFVQTSWPPIRFKGCKSSEDHVTQVFIESMYRALARPFAHAIAGNFSFSSFGAESGHFRLSARR